MHDASSFRRPLVEHGRGCAGATDAGPVRARNEDAFWVASDGSAFAVADGLGGLPAGDIASALAVEAAGEFFANARAPSGSGRRSPAELEQQVRGAAAHAHDVVLTASRAARGLDGMATTLVLIVVDGAHATVLHVGDSRAALWRDGRFIRMTIDQNRAAELLRRGILTAEEARTHPSRNLVLEVVGRPDGFEPECQTWEIEAGDVLLAFTDGISEVLSEERMSRILESAPSAAVAASAMVDLAASEGGHDNATVVIRRVT